MNYGDSKPRERQPITHLIFNLLVREIVKRLQDQHSEQHDRIDRLATGHALALCLRRQHRSLNVSAKALPGHQPGNGFKRVAFRRECRQPLIRIEKVSCPIACLQESCRQTADSHRFVETTYLRGALMLI